MAGTLVSLPLPRSKERLDGFLGRGPWQNPWLLLFVHGMHSNFYSSQLKKTLLASGPPAGVDVFSFNTRGHDGEVADERFGDCLADLDAVLKFAAKAGYRKIAIAGHSTGCQKAVYYLARRRAPRVRALVLLAPADDYAISRRALGRRHATCVRRAKALVAARKGGVPIGYMGFTARRFLSIALPTMPEARVFDYAGALRDFSSIHRPILTLFGRREEYACIPLARMGQILADKSNARPFDFRLVAGADHSFHGREVETVACILDWLRELETSA